MGQSHDHCWACAHPLAEGGKVRPLSDLLADLTRARDRVALHRRVQLAYLDLVGACVLVLSIDMSLGGPDGFLWLSTVLGIVGCIGTGVWFTDGLGGYEKLSADRHNLEKTYVRAALYAVAPAPAPGPADFDG